MAVFLSGYIDRRLIPCVKGISIASLTDDVQIRPILDTGFNREFCLPRKHLNKCKLARLGTDEFELADGRVVEEAIYIGEIIINKIHYPVEMAITDSKDALLGM
jgi:predicted aspartyl protease